MELVVCPRAMSSRISASAQISSTSFRVGGAAVRATMLNSMRTSGTSTTASRHMKARQVGGVRAWVTGTAILSYHSASELPAASPRRTKPPAMAKVSAGVA